MSRTELANAGSEKLALKNLVRRGFHSTSASGAKSCAVVLSGSGVYDGSEITEAVAALVHLSRRGVDVQCFAPDKMQLHAVNHTTGPCTASGVSARRAIRG